MGNPDTPFIERPDEHVEVGTELYCWLPGNTHRECGGDCVAFDPSMDEAELRTSCLALNALITAGAGLRGMLRRQKVEDKKKLVDSLPQPPEVG